MDVAQVARLVRGARRIAVLGIKTEAQAAQPAYYVPAYLAAAGLEVGHPVDRMAVVFVVVEVEKAWRRARA